MPPSLTSFTTISEYYNNGRGVIYNLKDEYNNECFYDFKNILYTKSKSIIYAMYGRTGYYYRNSTLDKTINNVLYYGFVLQSTSSGSGPTLPENLYTTTESLSKSMNLYAIYNEVPTLRTNNIQQGTGISNVSNEEYSFFTFNSNSTTAFDGSKNGYFCDNKILQNTGYNNKTLNNIILIGPCYKNIFVDCNNIKSNGGNTNNNIFINVSYLTFYDYFVYNIVKYCNHIDLLKSYVNNIIIENNQYITLTSTQTTSSSAPLRNIKICQGVNNTSTRKTISHNTVNDTFLTEYKPANSQVISV